MLQVMTWVEEKSVLFAQQKEIEKEIKNKK
jgi:hypothetical protein